MSIQELAAALRRAQSVLARRPAAGLHDDAPGMARWEGGTRVMVSHPTGKTLPTDIPAELGGSGTDISPGWLVRAGVASCAATVIAMEAAAEGLELERLEVEIVSRSDTRGALGMADGDGRLVYPGPQDLEMRIRIAAPGVPADQLHALVEKGRRQSPMTYALEEAHPVRLSIAVGGA